MSFRDVNRAVAVATGETVDAIERRGFHLLGDCPTEDGRPLVLDWDSGQFVYLDDLLSEEDWLERIDPLPSYDEEFEDDLDEGYACAAA